jgi:GH35 family endo-1,4-beta-xylanase
MNIKTIVIRSGFVLGLFSILICGSQSTSATPQSSASVYLPVAINDYESWSTNFANVTDPLLAAGIWGTQTLVAIDTTNVNSGGKSIKAYETIGQAGSCLNLAFGFWGVVGQNSVDLSDKTISLEIYLPADSPLDLLIIHVFSGGKFVSVRTAVETNHKGQWYTYTVDIREDITLKTWRSYSYMTSPGLTDDEAVGILKNAQTIAVIGSVLKDHTPAESYFLVDQMGWESAGPAPAYNPSLESLQQYAPANMPIGGLMEPMGIVEPEYVRHFVQEFNASHAWGLFPADDPGDAFPYDESWSPMPYADYFNETQGFKLIRYTGIGENPLWVPAWLPGKTYAQTQPVLENFIYALVDHYKGKTDIWILFNEVFGTDGGLHSDSDVSMIEAAFHVARAADPGALLIINDGAGTEGSLAGEALYTLVVKLKDDHTPIDGVGFEDHIELDQSGNFHEADISNPILAFDPVYGFTDIAENVERYAALGLKVAFTEVDVSIYLADIDPATPAGQTLLTQRRALQAAAYRSLLHIALTHPNVVFFNFWDWADEYSCTDQEIQVYRPEGFGNDLGLFDLSYQKKPSYYAVLDELKATQSPLPGTFNKLSPADGATNQSTDPTLSWGASTGAIGYEVCIDTSNDNGCSTTWIFTGTSTSVTTHLLPLTTYAWQVRAKGVGGVIHANSGTWGSFTTVTDWSTAVLKGHWNFDEGSGTAASDSSGNGNSGTLQPGASWAAGIVGPGAVALTGASDSFVNIPEAVVDTQQSYIVAAWVKLNALDTWQTAVSIDGVNNSGFYLQWRIDTGKFAFTVTSADVPNPGGAYVSAQTAPTIGVWYHLVGVFDGTSIKLYVNGELQGVQPYSSSWTAHGATAIGRAKYNGSNVDFFNGQIDDVRIYQGTLIDP